MKKDANYDFKNENINPSYYPGNNMEIDANYSTTFENYSFKDFFIDFAAGGIAGIAMLVSYYPLE